MRHSLFGMPVPCFEEDSPHVEVSITPAEEPEEVIDEISDVSEQLALHSIISEERHNEILERVESCQNRLEQLSTAESPSLAAIQHELSELRAEMLNLKSSMDSMQSNLIQSALPPPVVIVPEEPSAEVLTEEPEQVEPLPENQPPKRKNRFI